MNHLKFTVEKLRIEEINELVASEKCGAISLFVGTTRDNFEGKQVVKLEYEAYETMGLKSMETVCGEIRERWGDVEHIAIYHRLGTVPVKEASIVIAISSPHRSDAIKATEFCIENIKKSVPIWKKEIYNEGGASWKENTESKSGLFDTEVEQEVEVPVIPSHLIQIKANSEEIEQRINKFVERKRAEIDAANVRDFCQREITEQDEETCARIDSILIKRKDSKGHLQINKVYNTYSRDQTNSNYLKKYIPKNGVEERLSNLETGLSLEKPVPRNVYKRLKGIEERLLHLESISPEYVQFWDKTGLVTKGVKKKRIFSLNEIDSFINDLKRRK